jgi:hypothetical protein
MAETAAPVERLNRSFAIALQTLSSKVVRWRQQAARWELQGPPYRLPWVRPSFSPSRVDEPPHMRPPAALPGPLFGANQQSSSSCKAKRRPGRFVITGNLAGSPSPLEGLARIHPPQAGTHPGPSRYGARWMVPVPGLLALHARAGRPIWFCRRAQRVLDQMEQRSDDSCRT